MCYSSDAHVSPLCIYSSYSSPVVCCFSEIFIIPLSFFLLPFVSFCTPLLILILLSASYFSSQPPPLPASPRISYIFDLGVLMQPPVTRVLSDSYISSFHIRARICKHFKELRNRFPAWPAGATTRPAPPGYIGWRNRFLRIDSWAPETFTNMGSDWSSWPPATLLCLMLLLSTFQCSGSVNIF